MSAPVEGSMESGVEEDSEQSVESFPESTGSRTDDELLGNDDDNDGSSISFTRTITMDTQSNDERSFNPALPTGYEETDQATPLKDVVIEKANIEVDEGKSEKIVPLLTKKSTTERAEASKPPAKLETLNIDKSLIAYEEGLQGLRSIEKW